jgi:hypothetical protein
MIKKYKTSNLIKIYTLGLKRYGYMIDRGILTIMGLIPKHISIDLIDMISFELRSVGKGMSYFYIIIDKRGKEFPLSYSKLDGNTYQDLFRDILKINPNIVLTDKMSNFLNSEITHRVLKFDFNVHKGEFFKRDQELSQKYPSLDAFIGLTIVFVFFPIPLVFGVVGNKLLIDNYGVYYDSYRLWAIVIGGIAFMVTLTNLLISLVSMYLGHRLTFISLIITVMGLYIGFKI